MSGHVGRHEYPLLGGIKNSGGKKITSLSLVTIK